MTPEAKAAALALPTVTAFSPVYGMALGLGLLGGWLARAGLAVEGRMPWVDIKRQLLVSILISGGSIITTLVLAKLADADELGVAAIGFFVAFAGTDAIKLAKDYVLSPIVNAIKNPRP